MVECVDIVFFLPFRALHYSLTQSRYLLGDVSVSLYVDIKILC